MPKTFDATLNKLIDDHAQDWATFHRNLVMNLERESISYQFVIDRGRVKQSRDLIALVGQDKFGLIPAEAEAQLAGIEDRERLGRIARAILTANSWDELIAVG